MDANQMYYGGLVIIVILAWMSYNSNRTFTALLLLALGGYFIYSHNACDIKGCPVSCSPKSIEENSSSIRPPSMEDESVSR